MKIHAVFDEGSGEVIEVLARYGEVLAWDKDLDSAVAWAVSGVSPDPDLILIKSTVPLAQFDAATGTRRDRRLALLDAVRRMRLARPRARVVLLLPLEWREERAFLSNLVALGVYDFYFVAEFGEADLARWLSERRSLADVAAYLPGPGAISGPEPALPERKEEKQKSALPGLRRMVGGLRGVSLLGRRVAGALRPPEPGEGGAPGRSPTAAPEPGEPGLEWEEGEGRAVVSEEPENRQEAGPVPEEGLTWDEESWEEPVRGREPGPPPAGEEEGLAWEEGPWEEPEGRAEAGPEPAIPPAEPGTGVRAGEPDAERDPVREEQVPQPQAPEADVYALGLAGVPEGVAAFDAREDLFEALARKKPRAIVLSAGLPGCGDLVRELRAFSRLADVALAVVGRVDPVFVAAGADDCFERFGPEERERLLARQERLVALWQEAGTDHLTGLLNRRSLGPRLEEADRLFLEHGLPYSVIMLDLDRFKQINDTRGHSAGDEVLRRLGDYLRVNLRPRDCACRYGGEEIVLILAGTQLAEARSVAERLRRGWEALDAYGSTFSAGVAQAGRDGNNSGEVLAAADRALYAAKRAGRNRVVAAGEEPPVETESRPAVAAGPKAKLVAVASPSVRGVGASSAAALLAASLAAGGRRVAAVDADASGRGLAVRMGVEPHVASAYDWRKSDLPVYAPCGAAVWALDPGRPDAPSRERLSRVLDLALDGADFAVADLGAAPDPGLVERADLLVWVLREDRVAVEQALAYWPNRPRSRCQELGVLFGGGRAAVMVDLFVVPFYVLAGPEDRRGAAALARAAVAAAGRGLVVLAVGYDRPPRGSRVPLVWQPVPNYEAAAMWLRAHVPDLALVRPGVKNGDYLVARLRRRGIRVARPADAAELVAWIEREGGLA